MNRVNPRPQHNLKRPVSIPCPEKLHRMPQASRKAICVACSTASGPTDSHRATVGRYGFLFVPAFPSSPIASPSSARFFSSASEGVKPPASVFQTERRSAGSNRPRFLDFIRCTPSSMTFGFSSEFDDRWALRIVIRGRRLANVDGSWPAGIIQEQHLAHSDVHRRARSPRWVPEMWRYHFRSAALISVARPFTRPPAFCHGEDTLKLSCCDCNGHADYFLNPYRTLTDI